jgi:nicotinamide mononucleotide transporter
VILGLIYIFKKDDTEYITSFVPYVDSFTTAIFLVGMLFMALKRIENWIYWIIGDIISIPLYFIKGLVFTSFQYAVFLGLAIAGLIAWKRIYESTQNPSGG